MRKLWVSSVLCVVLVSCCVLLFGVASAMAGSSGCANEAFRTGVSASLPDCRVFERVTPEDKDGYDAPTQGGLSEHEYSQASPDGGSVVYMSIGSFAGGQGSGLPSAYVASRELAGWGTQNVTPPTPQGTPGSTVEYGYGYDFSEDLSDLVVKLPSQSLAPAGETATFGAYNLFLDRFEGPYRLITAATPSTAPHHESEAESFNEQDISAFTGANAGGGGVAPFTHVLFEVNESLLTSPKVEDGASENLYESDMAQPASERVHPVGVLPDGTLAAGSVAGAGLSDLYSTFYLEAPAGAVAHAISEDGSRIFWTDTATGDLYVREGSGTSAARTVLVAEGGEFSGASKDGSVVFYTKEAVQGRDLYEFDVDTEQTTDLAPGGEVQGVVGAAEDGSYVYFVGDGRLEGKGSMGEPNLYVWHEDGSHAAKVTFVATLDPATDASAWTAEASENTAYVTPDGRHLAFMSTNRLTGYDNEDLSVPGRADSEVFEYRAGERPGEPGSLVCASCDPSGARPSDSATIAVNSTPFHHPRVLNDEGTRLFFHLVRERDESQLAPVYEYEGGHAYLLDATGGFLDASASGEDVFLQTREALVTGDHDQLVDVYDARAGGEPPLPVQPVECVQACQGTLPAAPTFAAPGSAALSEPGSSTAAAPVAVSVKPRAKPLTRAQKLATALRACRSKTKSKRRGCEAQAKKRYGAKPKAKKTSRGAGR
jgi:hypothetical protein